MFINAFFRGRRDSRSHLSPDRSHEREGSPRRSRRLRRQSSSAARQPRSPDSSSCCSSRDASPCARPPPLPTESVARPSIRRQSTTEEILIARGFRRQSTTEEMIRCRNFRRQSSQSDDTCREWIMEARRIKEISQLDTSNKIYWNFINGKSIKPSPIDRFPDMKWKEIWINSNSKLISSTDRSSMFMLFNDLIPNKEKLRAYNIGNLQDSNCSECSQEDSNEHRIKKCTTSKELWNWQENVLRTNLKLTIDKPEDLLSVRLNSNDKSLKTGVWLVIRTISFIIRRYPNSSMFELRKEIIEWRWKNKEQVLKELGNWLFLIF
ncbi:uncharacterized protein LOC129755599 [Uranotaenia lowii]|uniref:uncharacterized protein LOC129755599 n=1 Tax=Uranotaenia lowii TaxID=190385 RepID=UPI00247A8A5A|nr:uncharacterized protein LOC129755599 [Uranotaenia lowii]